MNPRITIRKQRISNPRVAGSIPAAPSTQSFQQFTPNNIDNNGFPLTRPLGGPTGGRGRGVSKHPGSNCFPSALPQYEDGKGQGFPSPVSLPCTFCGHSSERHEIEPPYPCYECCCSGFEYNLEEL